ncbi:aspartate--tRNA ligase msd1 [Diatrype stigma]|uniref:Aspartate--tRNA ligase msd1 n=1 Tax=Diatrype stigma TaxID=117547 RepID=A0AAN9YWL1_9PEZI
MRGPGSSPAVLVCDHSKPLSGLAALGHEAAERLLAFEGKDWVRVADGDVLVIHARERVAGDDSYGGDIGVVDSANNGVSATDSANDSDSDSDSASDSNSDDIRIGGFGGFGITGGSTDLGRLRHAIYHAATKKGLMTHPRENSVLRAVWIYNFPLFTPRSAEDADPGQGGSAGFASTHHPFTAPLAATDLELLRTDPLRAKADHYDLVINGVEVGGGSRRIHVAEVQEFVLREVLRMGDAGVAQFAHLLGALRAGCPPHAGFAIGFDRLLTVLWDLPSVRDVMAFPKNNRGEDPLVASPSRTTAEQQRTYHLFRTETETETE